MAGTSSDEAERKPLSDEQIKEYREAFSLFDKDGNGQITVDELRAVLKTLGKNPTDEEVMEMINSVDENENGMVEFGEFLCLMEKEVKAFESEGMIRQAFEVFDQAGDGYITVRKLKQVIKDLGCQFTEEEIDEMMDLADQDGDGRVEYEGLIGLLSMQNESLFSAYQKRVRIEERQKQEEARRAEEAELAEAEIESQEPELVPDMNEIASQYEPEVYDQFSRKVTTDGRVLVKKPGKRVEMSRTRLKYLQRKNKALQTDIGAETDQVPDVPNAQTIRENGSTPSKSMTSPMTERWVGTIHDERQQFDARFVAKPPKQYKHVESRLKDPGYYLQKQNRKPIEPEYIQTSSSLTPRIDINKEIKDIKFHSKQKRPAPGVASSLKTVRSGAVSSSDKTPNPRRYVPHDNYSQAYKKDRHSMEKMYYALWRTAFANAIDKLRENKRGKILLNTPDLIAAKQQDKPKPKPKPVKRLSVISPSIEMAHKKFESDALQPKPAVQGSYTQRYRKLVGLENLPSVQPLVQQEVQQPKQTLHKHKRTHITETRGDVVTRSGLTRIFNIRT